MVRKMMLAASVLGIIAAAAQAVPVMPNTNGLIAYYLFDEASGSTALDGKGNAGNNGTMVGDTIVRVAATPFTYTGNAAMSFNAGAAGDPLDDDYIAIPVGTNTLDLKSRTGTYSISAWFQTTTTTMGNLVARAASNQQYQVLVQAAGTLKVNVGNSNTTQTSLPYNDGVWHNMVVSMSAGTGRLYVDGTDMGVTITPNSTNVNVAADTLIGARRNSVNAGSSGAYTGLMDEVAFFDYALSGDEAAWLANNSLATPEPATLCLLALGGLLAARRRRQLH